MPERFQIYGRAADDLEQKWGRGNYNTPDGKHCLVGSLFLGSRGYISTKSLLSLEMCKELDAKLVSYPFYRFLHLIERLGKNPERIQTSIEVWNDAPWRRKKTVVSVVRGLEAQSELEWLRSQIEQLRLTVAELQGERLQLLAEIESLRNENAFWRHVIKRNTLHKKSQELETVDNSLQAAHGQLENMQEVVLTYEK